MIHNLVGDKEIDQLDTQLEINSMLMMMNIWHRLLLKKHVIKNHTTTKSIATPQSHPKIVATKQVKIKKVQNTKKLKEENNLHRQQLQLK